MVIIIAHARAEVLSEPFGASADNRTVTLLVGTSADGVIPEVRTDVAVAPQPQAWLVGGRA
jgi:hypothetical protein